MAAYEGVQSCSSAESFSGVSEADESFEEIVVENESGTTEILLVSRRNENDSQTFQPPVDVPEEALGGEGFVGMFLQCVSAAINEEIIKRSPRGKEARTLLLELQKLETSQISNISVALISTTYACIADGLKHKLPSVAQCAVWKSFHQMRNDSKIKAMWSNFILTTKCTSSETHLTLQLLLDRLLKTMLKNEANAKCKGPPNQPHTLTQREENAIHYMAGYIAVSLLKKFKKPVKKPALKEKHDLFIRILSHMKAEEQPAGVDSVSDYTRVWSDLIDRGGLYHISDEVFGLIKAIEIIVRSRLNVPTVQAVAADTNHRELIMTEALSSKLVLEVWDKITRNVPLKYEKYSLELLRSVVSLWVTIRGYAFAKEWTSRFEKKYSRGVRKTLKS